MSSGLQLSIGPALLAATVEANGEIRWSQRLPWASISELRDAISLVSRESKAFRSSALARVSVEAGLLQQRELSDLPPVSVTALREIVDRGTSRFFRQNGHHLVSGAAWSPSNDGQARTAVAFAVDGLVVDAILAGSKDAGLVVEDILPAQGSTVSLLPLAERKRRARLEWRRTGKLFAVALGVWLIVLAAIAGKRVIQLRNVEMELARLREPRSAVQSARLAMDSAQSLVEAMRRAAGRRQNVARVLARIVVSLPDSTYLEELILDAAGRGSITGKGLQPSRVLRALQRPGDTVSSQVRLTSQPSGDAVAWAGFTIRFGEP